MSAATLSPVYPAASCGVQFGHERGELPERIDGPAGSVRFRDASDLQLTSIDDGGELGQVFWMRIVSDVHEPFAQGRAFCEVRRSQRGELVGSLEDTAHVVVRPHSQELEPNSPFPGNWHHSSIL